MKHQKEIARLEGLAQMILDVRLAELQRAASLRQESLDRLQALECAPADDLDPLLAARASLRYQAWADRRRAEINLVLARQTADWATKKASAGTAFARSEALRLLKARLG
ncbi:hypothetical protein LAZ40_18055 [Cereibacter sphaeroides]|uniref:hypothetical protein n=1 Tax=Rhodobacterales TaxID=204455 RepID=UPI000BBEAB4C|nr:MULTISPECIES: hypothetical protein [Paracoccaceae]MCE6952372.1 hypothetical protein [Cereibacter sphaeroides]MCE6960933.1 hypothetical protein [Cereibacter sphaeroides]MCE6969769.1 hypothetical protein [Cereibacter sphaeroides]MCE6975244.1 hypothetical protein [Cereibacter sphaeroides]